MPLLKTGIQDSNFCNEDNTWGGNLIAKRALPKMCNKCLNPMKMDGKIITNKK